MSELSLKSFGRYNRAPPTLAVAFGWDTAAAQVLTHLLWMDEDRGGQPFHITVGMLVEAMGMKRTVVVNARKKLVELKLISEVKRTGCPVLVTVNRTAIGNWWEAAATVAGAELKEYARQLNRPRADTPLETCGVPVADTPLETCGDPAGNLRGTPLETCGDPAGNLRDLNSSNSEKLSQDTEKNSAALAAAPSAEFANVSVNPTAHTPSHDSLEPNEEPARTRPARAPRPRNPKTTTVDVIVPPAMLALPAPGQADIVPPLETPEPVVAKHPPRAPKSTQAGVRAPRKGSTAPQAASPVLGGPTGVQKGNITVRAKNPEYCVRLGEVPKPTMVAWITGTFDGSSLNAAQREELMRVLSAIRCHEMKLETSAYDANDCKLVNKKLSAGYKPSELCRAVGGAARVEWMAERKLTLRQIWPYADRAIQATRTPEPTTSKETATREYLDARAEWERTCPWDARYEPTHKPETMTAALLLEHAGRYRDAAAKARSSAGDVKLLPEGGAR